MDIDYDGTNLHVAEKSNNSLLTYNNILGTAGGDLAADVIRSESRPESLKSHSLAPLGPDNSDIDVNTPVQNLSVSCNPGPAQATTGQIHRVDTALTSSTPFDAGNDQLESVKIDGQGDAFVTADNGILQFTRIGENVRDTIPANPFWDRSLGATNISSPKGLDTVDSRGYVIVANVGGPSITVHGKYGTGVIFTTPTPANPWDVDYDPINDRLYVAFTNGTVGVYDNYLDGANPNTAQPNRTITPTGSVNLHGIVYDAASDELLLSDVGSAADPTDGQLFVVANGSTADGNVNPTVTIGGPNSNLGNPVDVAYDGTNLFVAEKSNDLVMRFDNIAASGGGDVAPSAQFSLLKPESVSLVTGL